MLIEAQGRGSLRFLVNFGEYPSLLKNTSAGRARNLQPR
jgi:hypothetical protein